MASALPVSVQHGALALASPRRLRTSCAHRLRKPHRTCGPLTPSVTRRVSKNELSELSPTALRRNVNHADLPARPDPVLPRLV